MLAWLRRASSVQSNRCRPTLQSTGHAPASRVMPVISNVRHRGNRMHSLVSRREDSKRRERCFARGTKAVLPRAVRPLAASAPPLGHGALARRAGSRIKAPVSKNLLRKASSVPGSGAGLLCNLWPAKGRRFNARSSVQPSLSYASRRSARQGCSGRAATSFARGGGFGLFAGGVTQRTMHAGSVPQSALPNPSIERTNNGGSSFTAFANAQPPLFASHLKR